jgi:outer membrane protein assembly factor BamB
MGKGFSTISVSGGKAFCNAERDGKEYCVALNGENGTELWATVIDESIQDRQGGDGPRSTPTVDGEHVYVLGTHLKLLCLNVADGKPAWTADLKNEYGGKEPRGWGSAASPVIDGERIFVNCGAGKGQSLLALDKATGKKVWAAEDDSLVHSTPTPATIHEVRQIIFLTGTGLVSVKPEDGKVLWRYTFPHKTSTAASPVVGNDMVYCSAAYGVGAAACRIVKTDSGFEAKELWRAEGKLMNHWTTPIYKDGYLYGLFKEPSSLRCIEMATGKEAWNQPNFSWRGATTLVDGCILVQDSNPKKDREAGDLVLVEASPKGYHEIARCHPLDGQSWNMATIANGRIYARSAKEAVCLDVSGK